MRVNIFLISLVLILSLCPSYNYAGSEYQQKQTSLGRVILGLDRQEALERFGEPSSVSEDIWHYSGSDAFFVYFAPRFISSIYLYPKFYEVSTGVPLEFKAFGLFSNLSVKDITSQVEFLINQPQDFISAKSGIVIPKKEGDYQILAKYNDILSSPSHIKVEGAKGKDTEEEVLLSIDILPFKPIVPIGGNLNFTALGTFFDSSRNKYLIRDISQEAKWFIKQDKNNINVKDRNIFFPSLGIYNVFCQYRRIESFHQQVQAQNDPGPYRQTLKHIALFPEFIFANAGKDAALVAFGTYHNNMVRDITSKVKWNISDKKIVFPQGSGNFLLNSEGIAEIEAQLDNITSLASKINVLTGKESLEGAIRHARSKNNDANPLDLMDDIKNKLDKISTDMLKKEIPLKLIKIIPDYLKIPLGQARQLSAVGQYGDGSQKDLTLLGDWMASDANIVTVHKGKLDTSFPGEAKIYMKFQGMTSLPASVTVEGPRLVSIILSPQDSRISMKDSLQLKAEGIFSDSTRKDITPEVNWEVNIFGIIKISKGKVTPLVIGNAKVNAEYLGIRSLPVNIRVFFTKGWLISVLAKIAVFLFFGLIAIFIILYLLTKREINKLKATLDKDPKQFMVDLYGNTKKILSILGMNSEEFTPALSYAEMVQKKYSVEGNLFLRFTARFEEAKYSRHLLQSNDAVMFLNDYNTLLKIFLKARGRIFLFFTHCLSLLHTMPLFI